MTDRPDDLLELAREALGAASDEEIRQAADALGLLAIAVRPDAPSSEARQRLLAAASAGAERWAPFVDRLARWFDLGAERIREIVAGIDSAASWEAGPMPGIELVHFAGGPRVAAADNGLVRMAPGLPFPRHRHLGTERILVLAGSYTDDSGRVYGPGDEHVSGSDVEHAYTVGEAGVIYALSLEGDIWIEGMPGPMRSGG
jgi:hypothetical protein